MKRKVSKDKRANLPHYREMLLAMINWLAYKNGCPIIFEDGEPSFLIPPKELRMMYESILNLY